MKSTRFPFGSKARYYYTALLLCQLFTTSAFAIEKTDSYIFELPIMGDNHITNFIQPSMYNAIQLGASYSNASFAVIDHTTEDSLGRFGLSALATMLLPLPYSNAWVHEEFHIQSLKNVGLFGQKDGVYDFDLATDSIAVYGASDDTLNYYKQHYPQEWIRSHSAGYEGTNVLVTYLEKQRFFNTTTPANQLMLDARNAHYLINTLGEILYLNDASKITDAEMDEMNREESNNPLDRDLRGLDYITWTYDLFHPEQTLAQARRAHPSGVGLSRGVYLSQLNKEEQDYLTKQARLSYLNLVDPAIFGLPTLRINNHIFNANIKHYLTPFGYSLNVNAMYKTDNVKLASSVITHSNHDATFPGFSFSVYDYATRINKLSANATFLVFKQPRHQQFRTTDAFTGGLISVGGNYKLNPKVSINADINYKTEGWVAGFASLDKDTTCNVSIRYVW